MISTHELSQTTTAIPTPDSIDVGTLRHLLATDPGTRVIDVRTGGEFETAHIEGSFNIPLDTLDEHIDEVATLDHHVVLVCQTGGRASQAHSNLTAAGKQTLHILEGGLAAWEASGGDVVRPEGARWAMDRQVRLVAGAISLTGIAASVAVPGAKWIAGAVGAGLAYSATSNTCAMATVLSKLPYNRTAGCDIETVLADLGSTQA